MKVAIASCSSIGRDLQGRQPIWGIIKHQDPRLLILLGDNIYLGREGYDDTDLASRMDGLSRRYESQLEEEHFNRLLNNVDYLAVWDNHDFGLPGKKYSGEGETWGADVDQDFRTEST